MATQVTVITGEGSTTYSVSTGARGPAGPSSGATPAGTTGSVQINNSGALAADSGLVYTGTGNTGVLKIGGGSVIMSDPTVSQNVAIGGGNPTLPFANRTTGNYNTSIGTGNLPLLTTGSKNVAIGTSTLANVTTGSENFGFGVNTLFDLTSGTNNIAIGTGVAVNITTGADNICIGGNPLGATNVSSIAIGADSDGSSTTVIGRGGNAPNTQTRLIGNTLILGRQDLTTGTDKRTSIVQTAQTDNKTITLPNANGKLPVYTDTPAQGQVLTATDASGAATWEDASSGLQSVLLTPNLRGLNNTINSIGIDGDGPISIIVLGDSYATNFALFDHGARVVGAYKCGSVNSGGGQSGVTLISNDFTRAPDGNYNRVASGGTLACAHLLTGNPGPVTHIYYTLFPSAGTAQFSFSTNGGSSWTNVGSAINTATITDVLVGSIPISQYNSSVICRMQVTVGNVDGWIGQGCDGPGITQISFATQGQGIEQCADISPAIWKKMVAAWRAISPTILPPTQIIAKNYYTITTVGTTDFVTNFGASANTVGTTFRATATGSSLDTTTGRVSQSESQIILSVFADYRFTTVATTNYPTVGIAGWASSGPANDLYVNSRALNANPTCDWFLVGPHSVDPARNDPNTTASQLATTAAFVAYGINTLNTQIRNVDGAKAQRDFAERIGAGFVDCIPMFPNYTLAVDEGNYLDDIHLNLRGQLAKKAYVYNNSNLGWVIGSEAYRSGIRVGNVKITATANRSASSAMSVSTLNGLNLAPIIASDLRAGRSDRQETDGIVMWSPSANTGNIGFFSVSNNRNPFLVLDPNAFTPFSAGLITCGDLTRPWGMVNTNGLRVGFVKKTADYTIPRNSTGAQDYMIACDGTFTVTLPLARDVESSGQAGKVYIIKNIGIGVITVAAVSTNAIAATAMVNGTTYVIEFTGTTVFTSFGAASNNVGTSFVATGAGTGTGTLRNTLQKIDNVTTKTLAAGDTLRVISAQTSGFTSADWGNWLTW